MRSKRKEINFLLAWHQLPQSNTTDPPDRVNKSQAYNWFNLSIFIILSILSASSRPRDGLVVWSVMLELLNIHQGTFSGLERKMRCAYFNLSAKASIYYFILRCRKRDYISPILERLYWLPICRRVDTPTFGNLVNLCTLEHYYNRIMNLFVSLCVTFITI